MTGWFWYLIEPGAQNENKRREGSLQSITLLIAFVKHHLRSNLQKINCGSSLPSSNFARIQLLLSSTRWSRVLKHTVHLKDELLVRRPSPCFSAGGPRTLSWLAQNLILLQKQSPAMYFSRFLSFIQVTTVRIYVQEILRTTFDSDSDVKRLSSQIFSIHKCHNIANGEVWSRHSSN